MPENYQVECPCLYPFFSFLDKAGDLPVKFAIKAYFENKERINKRENTQKVILLFNTSVNLYPEGFFTTKSSPYFNFKIV